MHIGHWAVIDVRNYSLSPPSLSSPHLSLLPIVGHGRHRAASSGLRRRRACARSGGEREGLLSLFLLHRDFFLAGATSTSLVGVNYGLLDNNLPSPNKVAPLLRSIGVGRIKLYDANPSILRAFANTGVELIIGVPDYCVDKVRDPDRALIWTRANVQAFLPGTKIAAITVGNILTGNDTSLARFVLPAMESLHSALTTLGLDRQTRRHRLCAAHQEERERDEGMREREERENNF
ncbi:Glucan endo-1,3-beta-glucosidase 11 [Apostasia shenzhenica]|uniref:Glucan endo-1,3-beta-glucosidase 11 n=1 Tax=Apostasia shenzhenica TaxID=1088818 RepID=A0A2I0BGU7_9ASPA|nr:Glucan endo-1,3-beta-glucosidase 11 [Apostasia shenzhenica]